MFGLMRFLSCWFSGNFLFVFSVSGQRIELQTWTIVLYWNKGTFIKLSKLWNGPCFSLYSTILLDFLPRSNLKASSSLLDAVFSTRRMEACSSEEKTLSRTFPDSFAFAPELVIILSGSLDFFRQQKLCKSWNSDDFNGTGKRLHLPKRKIYQNVS